MSRFPLEEIEKKIGSKFAAVVVISELALKRSREFASMPASGRPNALRSAMEDIATGRVRLVTKHGGPAGKAGEDKSQEE